MDTEERQLSWEEVPRAIRVRIGTALPSGHTIWACLSRKSGGFLKPDTVHTEYYWKNEYGELVDAFWFDD
ncbi:MAG: hypothetical protein Q4G39_02875 [Brachymonas sp.]|nr:hypothetical protein [Brachymonas sp.]